MLGAHRVRVARPNRAMERASCAVAWRSTRGDALLERLCTYGSTGRSGLPLQSCRPRQEDDIGMSPDITSHRKSQVLSLALSSSVLSPVSFDLLYFFNLFYFFGLFHSFDVKPLSNLPLQSYPCNLTLAISRLQSYTTAIY